VAYRCFSLSLRDVETILAARGIVVSYDSIRDWGLRFGWFCQRSRQQVYFALREDGTDLLSALQDTQRGKGARGNHSAR
jgi:hypothetical protein